MKERVDPMASSEGDKDKVLGTPSSSLIVYSSKKQTTTKNLEPPMNDA